MSGVTPAAAAAGGGLSNPQLLQQVSRETLSIPLTRLRWLFEVYSCSEKTQRRRMLRVFPPRSLLGRPGFFIHIPANMIVCRINLFFLTSFPVRHHNDRFEYNNSSTNV